MAKPVRQVRVEGGRSVRYNVAVTEAEALVLERLAQRFGVTVQRLLVQAGLGLSDGHGGVNDQGVVDELRQIGMVLQEMRRQVIGVATNVNQLAHWANTHRLFPRMAEQVVQEELRPLIETLSRQISSAADLSRGRVFDGGDRDD